jgi:hypothetical protein
MGRPPKKAGELLRKNRTFRIRDSLDKKLIDAAKREGRSVSEEIEFRLEFSFLDRQP